MEIERVIETDGCSPVLCLSAQSVPRALDPQNPNPGAELMAPVVQGLGSPICRVGVQQLVKLLPSRIFPGRAKLLLEDADCCLGIPPGLHVQVAILLARVAHAPKQPMRGPSRRQPLHACRWLSSQLERIVGDITYAQRPIAGGREQVSNPSFDDARSFAHGDNTYTIQAPGGKCYHL